MKTYILGHGGASIHLNSEYSGLWAKPTLDDICILVDEYEGEGEGECPQVFEIGARVAAVVDNPDGNACIFIGTKGTIVCDFPFAGDYDWLVHWDDIDCGHDGYGACGQNLGNSGWFVLESEIEVLCEEAPEGEGEGETGWEADVAPRPEGDDDLLVNDWVQVGRFVAGLDAPAPGSEFQRGDCAPIATLGDDQMLVNDWVQAGRYVAGLDTRHSQGGPTNEGEGEGECECEGEGEEEGEGEGEGETGYCDAHYQVDDMVVLVVDNPGGASNLLSGTYGRADSKLKRNP